LIRTAAATSATAATSRQPAAGWYLAGRAQSSTVRLPRATPTDQYHEKQTAATASYRFESTLNTIQTSASQQLFHHVHVILSSQTFFSSKFWLIWTQILPLIFIFTYLYTNLHQPIRQYVLASHRCPYCAMLCATCVAAHAQTSSPCPSDQQQQQQQPPHQLVLTLRRTVTSLHRRR